jgi:hypothetical protein
MDPTKGGVMKASLSCLAALLLACAAAATVQANPWFPTPYPQAPDACGPGYYCTGPCGMVYGPNYCLRPAGMPFNGFVPPVNNCCGNGNGPLNSPLFPTHPYARGPRDFFMHGE